MAFALTNTIAYAVEGMDGLIDPYLVPGLMGHKNFTVSSVALGLPAIILLFPPHKGHPRWLTTLAMILPLYISDAADSIHRVILRCRPNT